MSWQFGQALDGNIAMMGEVDIYEESRVYDRDRVWRWASCGDCADDADARYAL